MMAESARTEADASLEVAFYRSLIGDMPFGFAYCKVLLEEGQPADFIYLMVNAAFERQTGLKGVAGKKISEVIPGIQKNSPKLIQRYARVAASGKPERFEAFSRQLRQWYEISAYRPKPGHFIAVFDDITQRKQVEAALSESEARFRQLADSMPQLVWVARPDGFHEYFNGKCYEYTGFRPGEVDENAVWPTLLHPDDYQRVTDSLEQLSWTTAESYTNEYRLLGADGKYRWFLERALPVRDDKGDIVRWYGTCTDIEEQKQGEEAISKNIANFKMLFSNAGEGIFIGSMEGKFLDANERGAAMFGYSHKEIVQLSVADVLAEHERERVPANWDGWEIGSGAISEWMFLRKDGSTFLGEVNSRLLPDGRFMGIMRDISEKRKSEEALKDSEARFRQLAEAMPLLVWTADPDGRVDYYNEYRNKYAGISVDEAGTYDWKPALHPDDVESSAQAMRHAFSTGSDYQSEQRGLMKDGSYRWHISRGVPIRNEQGQIIKWFGTATDVHDLKMAKEAAERNESQLRLAQLVSRIGSFEWLIQENKVIRSPELVALHGMPPESFDSTHEAWLDCIHPEDREKAKRQVSDAMSTGVFEGDWRVVWPDGSIRWISARGHVVKDESGMPTKLIGINIDVTDSKLAEERERRLTNLYRAVSATNEAIMFSPTEAVLFPVICRIATEHGDMSLAWVGIPDTCGKFIPVAHDGIAADYIQGLTALATPNLAEGRGPVGTTYRQGQAVIVNDIESSAMMAPWKTKAATQGLRSMATFPMFRANKVYGVFILASAEKDAFDEEIVQLLKGMTENVSFALHNFDLQSERKSTEAALRQSESRFRSLADAMPHLVWIARTDGFIEYFNSRCYEYTGYEKGAIEQENEIWPQLIHPDDYLRVMDGLKLLGQNTRETQYDEYRILGRDGTYRWFMERTVPIHDDAGNIIRWYGSCTDIHEKKQAEQRIRGSEEKFRTLVESASDSYVVHDFAGKIIEVNPMACEAHGYTRDELIGMSIPDINKSIDLSDLQEIWKQAQAGRVMAKEGHHERKDGSEFPVAVRVSSIQINGAELFLSLVRDVTEQQQAADRQKLAAMVYQDSSEAMMVADAKGRIMAVNPAFEKITGFLAYDVIGNSARAFFRTVNDEIRSMDRALRSKGQWKGELWSTRKNGSEYAISLTVNTSFNADGTADKRVYLFSDITSRKQTENLIWEEANFDALTGLPNRRFFRDRLDQEIRNARRSGLPLALMFLDLDGFKYINDTLGHDMGDILLKEASERLFSCVRETDTVARMGGDEFTVILSELQDATNIERIARHILRVLSEPIILGEETAYVSASIGITLYPQDAADAEELIRNADQAMYAAKESGKNRFHYFTPEMQEEAVKRMRLINDMRGALEANQFEIVYQPIIELSSGAIHKAEALIRWQHPTKGLVNPIDFISAAEDTGMITAFGNWIFREAAKQAAIWRERHHPAFQISVNISPVQFRNEGIDPSVWFDHLRSLGLPGQGVVVEITEGLLLEASSRVTDQLLMLRDAGIEVALDDFGTGYSSLSYLKKFDIDYIKIDQTFVSNLHEGSDDMALCEAIIVMAHRLGIRVIAEGVEKARQHELLANGGCDFAQGYLFSRPVPAEEFEVMLQSNPFAAQESFNI